MSRIFVLYPGELSKTMGTTEPYYVIRALSNEHDIHVFAQSEPGISGVTFHRVECPEIIPGLIWFNLLLIPYYVYHSLRSRPDYLYTYKGYNFSSYTMQLLFDVDWIADFRTAPVEQAQEKLGLRPNKSTIRVAYLQIQRLIYKITLPACADVITLSDELVEVLSQSYQVDENKIEIVPLGVDTEVFKPNYETSDEGQFHCVYTGSIRPVREMEACLEAVSIAQDNGVPVRLHLVGGGDEDYVRSLRSYAEELGISDAMEWHGYVNHAEIPSVLRKMDVGISHLPDREMYRVSSPTKVYEYLASGLPVVCSDIIAHEKILEPGETGFFYDPDNPDEFAERIESLASIKEEEFRDYCNSARQGSLEHDWAIRIDTIKKLLD
jgi:glycosyltransferase involved in cell wall biosynthesis